MPHPRRILSAAGVAIVAAGLVAAPGAAAFSAGIVIRTAAVGRVPQVTDIATAGGRVVTAEPRTRPVAPAADARPMFRAAPRTGPEDVHRTRCSTRHL